MIILTHLVTKRAQMSLRAGLRLTVIFYGVKMITRAKGHSLLL